MVSRYGRVIGMLGSLMISVVNHYMRILTMEQYGLLTVSLRDIETIPLILKYMISIALNM